MTNQNPKTICRVASGPVPIVDAHSHGLKRFLDGEGWAVRLHLPRDRRLVFLERDGKGFYVGNPLNDEPIADGTRVFYVGLPALEERDELFQKVSAAGVNGSRLLDYCPMVPSVSRYFVPV